MIKLEKGVNMSLAYGYQLSKNIGVELDACYLIGATHKFTKSDLSGESETSFTSRMIRITPSVIFSYDYQSLRPYMRMGIIMASGNVYYNFGYDNDESEEKYRLYGGIGVGVSSAVGTFIQISKLQYFAEIDFTNYSYSPPKGELSIYIDSGVNLLPGLTTSGKEFEFVDEFKEGDFNNDGSKPTKLLKNTYPFGSLGINVGLIINL